MQAIQTYNSFQCMQPSWFDNRLNDIRVNPLQVPNGGLVAFSGPFQNQLSEEGKLQLLNAGSSYWCGEENNTQADVERYYDLFLYRSGAIRSAFNAQNLSLNDCVILYKSIVGYAQITKETIQYILLERLKNKMIQFCHHGKQDELISSLHHQNDPNLNGLISDISIGNSVLFKIGRAYDNLASFQIVNIISGGLRATTALIGAVVSILFETIAKIFTENNYEISSMFYDHIKYGLIEMIPLFGPVIYFFTVIFTDRPKDYPTFHEFAWKNQLSFFGANRPSGIFNSLMRA